jgi:hypothetical protein
MFEPLSGSAANSIGQRLSHAKPHSHVIGNQQGTGLVDGQPDWPSAGLSSEFRKPVTTSSALPLGRPPLNGTKKTL